MSNIISRAFYLCMAVIATGKAIAQPYSGIKKRAFVFTTAQNTSLRMTLTDTSYFKEKGQPYEDEVTIFIDTTKKFQAFLGIGGAITDAAAETFYKIPKEKQKELIEAYYSRLKGIGYTIARTNINSCDFSSDMYTYVEKGDMELKSFSIDHDKKYKIPLIKEAIKTSGNQLRLFASPWSPPAWMKDNNDMLHGGKLLSTYYDAWANYYVKFINAYKNEGVDVWGVSIQNEPMAKQTWESCIYTAEEEKAFLKYHLGPTFQKQGLSDKKIIVWDHNRDMLFQRAQTYFSDPEAAKYAWGIGFHWYEDWSGGTPMYDNVRRVNESFPDKNLFFTEGCAESFDAGRYYNWSLGEKYARSMINDFNNGMVGFTDWNILLDETGGPNHAKNFCFAPVHADTRTGELIYTNAYYYIGHFSKYILPGAKRIACSSSRSQLMATAFQNPDGTTVVVVFNQTDKAAKYNLWINNDAVEISSQPHSIATIIF